MNIMNKAIFCILTCLLSILLLSGCSNKIEVKTEMETEQSATKIINEEQAISAIQNYCLSNNPDLERIIDEGEYSVYWDILSSDKNQIVVLYRSYTGAQNRYYIDRNTGDTYVTEFVPVVMDEEERTDESFNVIDYYK